MPITSLDKLLFTRRTGLGLLPLVSPTTRLGAGVFGGGATFGIGFTFNFDGVDYTNVFVGSVGFARLAGTYAGSSNAQLFAASTDVLLAPWFDALATAPTDGYLKSETQGAAPWRRCILEWRVAFNTDNGGNYNKLTYQLVLYETSNRIEFRYRARETLGSPATMSASLGVKGDTSVVTTNFRDLNTDNRPLGASNTTAATALTAADYDALVTSSPYIRIEPNWPMTGKFLSLGDELLNGLQDPFGDPIWHFANNLHWLYCRHTPPIVDLAPYNPTAIANPVFVAPCRASADVLVYRCWIEIYSAAGGNFSCGVYRDSVTHPQPAVLGDWGLLTSSNYIGAPAGYASWASFTFTLTPTTTTLLRFAFVGTINVLSIMVAPEPLTDFDPTASYASGFEPVGLGQLRQQGAGVHAEVYNRIWRVAALIAADRAQALWSAAFPDSATYAQNTKAGAAVRVIGVAPASLKEWRDQDVAALVYAYNVTNPGGKAVLQERGGNAIAFVVDSNGNTYRRGSGTLSLVSDEPTIVLSVDPNTSIRIVCACLTWSPALDTSDLIQGTTPAPRLEYLVAIKSRLERVFRAWAMTGLATMLERTTGTKWVCAWMVPPAVKALRPKLARSDGGTGTPAATSIYAASSGAFAADEIVVPSGTSAGADTWPPESGHVVIVAGAEVYNATPAAAGDRLLESPTDGLATQATREKVDVIRGVGMCLVPIPSTY